uniref:Serine/threonine-protein kinase Nek7 n=2 Tax=Ascaris TaxID=6251 RepID=F1L0Y3_ASCSU
MEQVRHGSRRSEGRGSELRRSFGRILSEALKYVQFDARDQWPLDLIASNYARGDVLSSGRYGQVVSARARPITVGFTHVEPRACVIKTCEIGARLDACVRESRGDKQELTLRLARLTRRIVMEIYILNRVRHSNIMHAHVTTVDELSVTVHMVLPRFYTLDLLINKYRRDKDGEPMPVRIILMIIRQLCRALDYLHSSNIVHSDIQPENIYITRGGTVKLGHFACARMLTSEKAALECRTPTGREEFMCFEKQFNLRNAHTLDECMPFTTAADIWSVGVLVLHMVCYFPNEKWHRLPRNFALQMGQQKMPFKWMVSEMVQLRVRLTQSGDEQLKKFLSDKLLNIDAESRATAQQVLDSSLIKKWCFSSLDEDKSYLVRKLIHELDWPNRFKLESDGFNYDACEAKDIPAEFYWDDTWKELEKRKFGFVLAVFDAGVKRDGSNIEQQFSHADISLFEVLLCGVESGELEMFDIFAIDQNIRNLCFTLMRGENSRYNGSRSSSHEEITFKLPPSLNCTDRMAHLEVFFI